jgi:hypothetical protein
MPWLVSALHACTLLAPSDAELTSPETAGEDSGTHDSRGDESEVSSPEPDADASHGDASDAPADACGPPLTPCSPNERDSEQKPCGACNSGVQTRSRSCLPELCDWSPWSAWGTCSNVTAVCTPGDREIDVRGCGLCNTGQQSRSRVCSSACAWDAWSAWGTCGGVTAECEPDHWRCCSSGAWEWCRASTCMWSGACDATSCASSPYCTC